MKRFATTVIALGCASLVYAQSDKVKTKVKAEDGARVVSYSGCVQTTPSHTYVLEHVAPVSRETTINADGSASTTNPARTYAPVVCKTKPGFVTFAAATPSN